MVQQTILPFKLEMTKDTITPHAGLALLGEFAVGLGLLQGTDRYLPSLKAVLAISPLSIFYPSS